MRRFTITLLSGVTNQLTKNRLFPILNRH